MLFIPSSFHCRNAASDGTHPAAASCLAVPKGACFFGKNSLLIRGTRADPTETCVESKRSLCVELTRSSPLNDERKPILPLGNRAWRCVLLRRRRCAAIYSSRNRHLPIATIKA